MSENKPDNNRPVDPVTRLRSALDRIAFALEYRRQEVPPSAPETIVEEPQPDVQKALATLDALMVDVRNVLGNLAPAHPLETPPESSTYVPSQELSDESRDWMPEGQAAYDDWGHTPAHDASQHGEGY
ncbi:hypothetical protein [Acetobacter sp.]|jgi:hypothetical protein|uniref:hypothetical protein n=1 Tax=Acetobacter sp. TaxID=440 RepID=UPI0025BFFBC5|nr:hypothetical protein [Acetobacter sp.]MCH4090314.1 hypothetical protein [Acetobacter sp.]MCI1299008.1 hypothetical protein [Acetobacter sp.]MCI1315028.1 hypothetical protein [Acetobacter sp.]